jgi:sugar/nucleoside kinase (ribokinase family)
MTGSGIACAGNWILDTIHDIPRYPEKSELVEIAAQRSGLGGGAANVACDLVTMGAPYPVLPVGLIGQDATGDRVLDLCATAGLSTAGIRRTDRAATAQTHVMNVPGESRTFFYHGGANDLLDETHIDLEGLAASGIRLFYLGYVGLLGALDRADATGRSGAGRLLERARALGLTTCVDLVSSNAADYGAKVFAALPGIDVLFLNEIEAARATGMAIAGAGDTAGMEAAARALRAGGVARAVIVHSAEATVWLEDDRAEVFTPDPVPPERIVSTVGAGDAFAAGVLHGLHEGWDRARSVDLAFRAAAACLGGATATDGLGALGRPLAGGQGATARS